MCFLLKCFGFELIRLCLLRWPSANAIGEGSVLGPIRGFLPIQRKAEGPRANGMEGPEGQCVLRPVAYKGQGTK